MYQGSYIGTKLMKFANLFSFLIRDFTVKYQITLVADQQLWCCLLSESIIYVITQIKSMCHISCYSLAYLTDQ